MMKDMNMEGDGPSLEEAYHSVIELLVGVVSTVPIVITFAFSYTKQFTDLEWLSACSIALLSSFSQSLGYLNSLYKSGALPEWLRDGRSRLLYFSSLAACIASATLSFVGALVMLNMVKSDMYSDQLKCFLLWYLVLIIMCSVVNLVRMAVFAALSTKYAVTGELKIVGYVNYISEPLNKVEVSRRR